MEKMIFYKYETLYGRPQLHHSRNDMSVESRSEITSNLPSASSSNHYSLGHFTNHNVLKYDPAHIS